MGDDGVEKEELEVGRDVEDVLREEDEEDEDEEAAFGLA